MHVAHVQADHVAAVRRKQGAELLHYVEHHGVDAARPCDHSLAPQYGVSTAAVSRFTARPRTVVLPLDVDEQVLQEHERLAHHHLGDALADSLVADDLAIGDQRRVVNLVGLRRARSDDNTAPRERQTPDAPRGEPRAAAGHTSRTSRSTSVHSDENASRTLFMICLRLRSEWSEERIDLEVV